MSDAMRDALILSGVLLAIVLFTHIGRHRVNIVLLVLPFITSALVGWGALYDLHLTTPNMMASLVGIGGGALIGAGLLLSSRVEWDTEKQRAVTRCGWIYLVIWLIVLVGRLIFTYELEHNATFAQKFGKFLMDTQIDPGGVSAFFVTMALTMVIVRTIGVWVGKVRVTPSATEPALSMTTAS